MTNSAQVLLIPHVFVVPAFAQHRGGSTVVEPERIGSSTRSDKSRNHRFGLPLAWDLRLNVWQKTDKPVDVVCTILTSIASHKEAVPMRAPVDLSRGLCSDQEQPLVLPQLGHTEQDPAGTVGAPQSMQGSFVVGTVSSCSGVSIR